MLDRFASVPKSRGRRLLVLVSFAVHGIGAFGLLLASVLHVDEIGAPPLMLTYFASPTEPPPARGSPTPSTAKRRGSKRSSQPALPVEPRVAPERPAGLEPASDSDRTPGSGESNGDGAGEGDPNGVIGAPPVSGLVAKAPPARPKNVASFVFDRQRLSAPDPHLSAEFWRAYPAPVVSGTYRVCIGSDGRIFQIAPTVSIPGQDERIMEHLRRTWVYRPQPIPVCSQLKLEFRLR